MYVNCFYFRRFIHQCSSDS